MEVLVSKIVAMVVLMMMSLLVGLLPGLLVGQFWFQSGEIVRSTSGIISLLSCFGGGVFLSTCLLDLIPDVRSSVEEALGYSDVETTFPLADFIVAIGLFLILIIEQTALTFKRDSDIIPHHYHDHEEGERRPLLDDTVSNGSLVNPVPNYTSGITNPSKVKETEAESSGDHPINDEVQRSNTTDTGSPIQIGSPTRFSGSGHHSSGHHSIVSHSHSHVSSCPDECHNLHSPSKFRSFLLLGALSVHSIFEGLAMGVQEETHDVWTLFLAVSIHKSVLAFSLGINFLKSGMGIGAMLRSLVLFSVMAPLGITVGIIIIQFSGDFKHSIANGIIQGLATGTFLYITFFEVLPHEMNASKDRLLKVLAILLGFSVISILILMFPP